MTMNDYTVHHKLLATDGPEIITASDRDAYTHGHYTTHTTRLPNIQTEYTNRLTLIGAEYVQD